MALKIPEFDQVVLPKVGANEQLQNVTYYREQTPREYEIPSWVWGACTEICPNDFQTVPLSLLDT